MKRYILLALAVTITVANSASGQSAKQKAAIELEIRRLDLAHADAVLRGDQIALDKLWTEDFKVNNPFNEIDKADRIRTGAVTYSSFVREPEAILIHGETVIVMGRETVIPKGNSPDAGKTINRRYTNIWMKREGQWRLVARHANVICQKLTSVSGLHQRRHDKAMQPTLVCEPLIKTLAAPQFCARG